MKGAQGFAYLWGLCLGSWSRLLPRAERCLSRAVFKPPGLLAPTFLTFPPTPTARGPGHGLALFTTLLVQHSPGRGGSGFPVGADRWHPNHCRALLPARAHIHPQARFLPLVLAGLGGPQGPCGAWSPRPASLPTQSPGPAPLCPPRSVKQSLYPSGLKQLWEVGEEVSGQLPSGPVSGPPMGGVGEG